jgi:hypothetical protein
MSEQSSSKKWLPDIIRAFQEAGGSSGLPKIYRWIQMQRISLPREWQSVIRATIYSHSSDSPVYKTGDPDIFRRRSYGLWALRHPSETVIGKSDNDFMLQAIADLTTEQFHSYAGNGDALIAFIKEQAQQKKRMFKVE